MAEKSFSCFSSGEDGMRNMMGPCGVDQQIRHAIQHCWMIMPADRKNVDAVEAEIRRLVDRALQSLREDSAAFGFNDEK